jgi:SAM-dependent methyltransferase
MKLAGELGYRVSLGLFPQPSDAPDRGLMEMIERPSGLRPGRALDLGSGTGRTRHGWEVTGVELAGAAVATARRKAADAGLSVRFVEGDVTKLGQLAVGDGYTLLVDAGCYHGISPRRRDAYAAQLSKVADRDARLLLLGFAARLVPGLA